MTFAKPYPWPTPVFVYEFDAGAFKSLSQNSERRSSGLGCAGFYLPNRDDTDFGLGSEILLAPIEEAARCSTL